MKEEGIMDLLLKHGDKLTCFNCGRSLTEVGLRRGTGMVAVLNIDPGRSNYPREPDEPAEVYFECRDCYEEKNALFTCTGRCSGENVCEHAKPHRKKKSCERGFCNWCSHATGQSIAVECRPYGVETKTIDLKAWKVP